MKGFERVLTRRFGNPDPSSASLYRREGGYLALEKALGMQPSEIVEEVKRASLFGRGGAGFPAGLKWEFCSSAKGDEKYLVVNADESEPGTFKDVHIMEKDPHLLIEGTAIAALAIGARRAYIYIRGEFSRGARILGDAIRSAEDEGILGSGLLGKGPPLDIHVHRGAGAYICGEETGLLESLEGKPGNPRLKPPFPVVKGAWGSPTVVNNVETLACVPSIIERGAAWFTGIGSEKGTGPKLYAVSGQVRNPGVFEGPTGLTLRSVIFDLAGGTREGRRIQAVFPGGSSAPPLREDELDVTMDFKSLQALDSMIGSAGVIVIDDSVCMVEVARNVMHFYAEESCGKCTPCRDGCLRSYEILKRISSGKGREKDLDILDWYTRRIFADCLCPLAKGAMWSLKALLSKWREDFESHIGGAGCGRGIGRGGDG